MIQTLLRIFGNKKCEVCNRINATLLIFDRNLNFIQYSSLTKTNEYDEKTILEKISLSSFRFLSLLYFQGKLKGKFDRLQRVESPLSHEGSSRNRSIDPMAVHHKLDITKVPESIFVKFSIDSPVSLVARHSGTLDASIHRSNKGCFAGLTTDLVIDSSLVNGRVKKSENFHIIIFMQIFI